MENKDNKISFTCGSLTAGSILSSAIIIARALQANAVPMHMWSIKSWIWMTSPIWLQIAFGATVGALCLLLMMWQDIKR